MKINIVYLIVVVVIVVVFGGLFVDRIGSEEWVVTNLSGIELSSLAAVSGVLSTP